MLKNIHKLSASPPIKWDKHCLLVIQFPISRQSEIRFSARFDGMKLELRQAAGRLAPHWARDFFRHPSTLPFSFSFAPFERDFGRDGTPQLAGPVLPPW